MLSPVGSAAVLAAGDFNGDHIPDALVKSAADGVKLFLGTGKGMFATAGSPVAAGTGVTAIAVGDFNGDGKLDAAFANGAAPSPTGTTLPGDTVTVVLGDSKGGFSAPHSYFAGAAPADIAIGDFNGDGATDLAVADGQQWSPPGTEAPATYGAAVLLNNGDGTFGVARKIFLSGPQTHIAAGDVNGDGSVDLAFAGPNLIAASPLPLATLTAALNDGSASFTTKSIANIAGHVGGLDLVDLNHDGNADLAGLQIYARTFLPTDTYFTPGDATVFTWLSKGDGAFGPVASRPVPISRAAGLSVADFDGDGRLDFAVAGQDMRPTPIAAILGGVAVVRGLAGGTLGGVGVFRTGGAIPLSQAALDLNGDGRTDLLTGSNAGLTALLNQTAPPPTAIGIDPTFTDPLL